MPLAAREAQKPIDSATQAAFFVQTELYRPTRTATPLPTLTPTQTPAAASATPFLTGSETPLPDSTQGNTAVQVTAQPGLALYTHPDIPDYVFQIDPGIWVKDPSGKTANLVNKMMAGCRIESVPGHGLAAPKRLLWQDFGRFRWEVMDYGSNAYVVPVSGRGVSDQGSNNFLNLAGYSLPACRSAQEQMLSALMTRQEAAGGIPYTLFQSPTPRPALEGFRCPNTPPARLRVGDQVSVITDGLWLRSAPQADESTKLSKYLRYAPVFIRVVNGPVCEKYVYWQVEVSTFGEASVTTQGWLAEGDPTEYYLVAVK